ncbi:lytic transglycosylase domain-containing protein [Varunaivibrio sulfuroxidans]|nr:lytic transglycosylase domain-containing protein [Varunaivibrio sulfuroxidans]WES31344.1 lytic transglycosylase domain-containing protein [Varunaivibrio sulfuroxidans]
MRPSETTAGGARPDPARFFSIVWSRLLPVAIAMILLSLSALLGGQSGMAGQKAPRANSNTAQLSARDIKAARAAFRALDEHQWKHVPLLAARIKDNLTAKVVMWSYFSSKGNKASFNTLSAFIRNNPDWPYQRLLRRRAEEAMTQTLPPDVVLAWFRDNPITSTDGRTRYIEALMADGQTKKAHDAIIATWREANFGRRQEKSFYKRYKNFFTTADNVTRLDRLIWEGRVGPARRMLWRVDKPDQALAIARLFLMRREGNVDRAIAKVPRKLRNDPGLVYERVRWRRRKGKTQDAIDLLLRVPPQHNHSKKWWTERSILARRALDMGAVTDAYALASHHGLTPRSPVQYADAEWLSGWIALRFLNDPKQALRHFQALYAMVKYPVSKARGAYWIGRAYHALKKEKQAADWFHTAARYSTTYYGQLSMAWFSPQALVELPPLPHPSSAEIRRFESHQMTRVVKILHLLKQERRMRPFMLSLAGVSKSPGWRALSAALAREQGRADLAITIAKSSQRAGAPLGKAGYPLITPPPRPKRAARGGKVEPAFLMAVIRQESAFYPGARSHAGARGLMQLMPSTARRMARGLRMPYSHRKLLTNPRYNVALGRAYLGRLITAYNGSYVLALAAYNAGPARAKQWINLYGDPRDPSVDVVDWVEQIPFNETRNYVQRVMENLQVYRRRLGQGGKALNLVLDLNRPNGKTLYD